MSNPLCPLLIVGMLCCFVVIMSLVLIVRRCLIHFMESREADDTFQK